jgi:signal transduction histidine kinase
MNERGAASTLRPMNAVIAVAGVVAAAGVGAWVGRHSIGGHMSRLEEDHRQMAGALERRAAASHEDRAVRDQILASMQEGVLLFDPNARTVFANEALIRHLGSRPDSLAQVFPASLRETIGRTAETRSTQTIELETGAPSRWLRATSTPAGTDGSVLAVVTDVTEARRLDAVRRDFVANASHELKTPAASIQAAAETLLHAADDDPAAVQRFAGQLEREAVRLSRIVTDLLDLSRLETGSDLHERIHLDALVREETERFLDVSDEAGLTLTADAASVPSVLGSARDCALMIRNLLDNAIRYSPPGGSVRAQVSSEDDTVVLRVIDTGVGIPRKDLDRIFERFFRVDRARSRETGGTGLGLSIVRHVVENHGGTLAVQSELGRGTTMTVRLPAATPA